MKFSDYISDMKFSATIQEPSERYGGLNVHRYDVVCTDLFGAEIKFPAHFLAPDSADAEELKNCHIGLKVCAWHLAIDLIDAKIRDTKEAVSAFDLEKILADDSFLEYDEVTTAENGEG